jgi:hypothetical protein
MHACHENGNHWAYSQVLNFNVRVHILREGGVDLKIINRMAKRRTENPKN